MLNPFPLARQRRLRVECSATQPSQRILIYANELYRLPMPVCRVRSVSGVAYITRAGRDIILCAGESVAFDGRPDRALVSPLGNHSLTLELFMPSQRREGLHTVADKK